MRDDTDMNPLRFVVHLYIGTTFLAAAALLAIVLILNAAEMTNPVAEALVATVPDEAR